MKLLRPLGIGDVVAENNLLLAPMAGYTDVAFRILARRGGAGITSTEQVGTGSFDAGGRKTALRAVVDGRERPVLAQLITADVAEARAVARTLAASADLLSINFGCPAPQVARAGCGAALLDRPEDAVALVRAVVDAGRPVVPKMRLGNGRRIDHVAFARALVDAGAAALIVHGRAACDGYSGRADWAAIGRVVAAVDVPVLANGDVVDGPSAEACLASTGAAGIAIGRAALGDPRVFARIAAYLTTGKIVPPDRAAQVDDLVEYLRLAEAADIPRAQVFRQAQRFTKGLHGAGRLRATLSMDALGDLGGLVARLRAAAARPLEA